VIHVLIENIYFIFERDIFIHQDIIVHFPDISKLISRVSSLSKSEIFTSVQQAAKGATKNNTNRSIDSLHAGKTCIKITI